MGLETTIRCYRVDRRQISFIKFILEAYDNIAVMSTVESRQAVVQIRIAPGCEKLVDGLVKDFSREFEILALNNDVSDGRDLMVSNNFIIENEPMDNK